MAQSERESLCSLEHLMEEFFNTNTSNARKHDIEMQLSAFSSQRDSWKMCIYFLNHTSSQYVSMYALSTIESVINRQWFSLEWEQRTELKGALDTYLIKNNVDCPNFLRNKLAKLMVDIARHDWAHFYPEYIANIIEFLQSEEEQLLGLVLLRTASEEIMSNRLEISSSRKQGLQGMLSRHVHLIFQHLTALLDRLALRRPGRRAAATATPPPSPTQPSDSSTPPPLNAATFRPDARDVSREALCTLQHLFSWIDLCSVTPPLLSAVFQITSTPDDDLCILALSTINELLYRKCAPPGTQNLFVELYHYAVQLLRDITNASADRIDNYESDFIDKLTEFLCLLVSQHLWRLEADNQFSALDFLSLLYQCTFQQTTMDAFLGCLGVWHAFIKQLKPENAFKYSEALLTLVKQVSNKMQFMHNQNQLEDLDNELIDDDNETEWQHFAKECIEIIALVAEIIPLAVFNLVWMPWRAVSDMFYMIEKAVDVPNRRLNLDPIENQRLHCILRDLSTLTQTLARLSTIFTDQDTQHASVSKSYVDLLLSELLKCSLYITRNRFDSMQLCSKKLTADFIEVHAQILAGLKTWCLWLVMHKHDHSHQVSDIVTITTSILLNGPHEPAKLSLSAAHLLLCLTNMTFPPSLITLPPIVELLRNAPHIKYQDEHSVNVLHQSMCNLLIRPWGDLNDSDKNQRMMLIQVFFDALTKDFRTLTVNTNETQVQQVVLSTLPYISRIIEYCKHHSTASKKLLISGLQETIQKALTLFPKFADSPEINNSILELILVVLEVLQLQMDSGLTKVDIQVILDVAINEQRVHKMSGLDKLLQILQLVVEGPGQTYKLFLPGIISLCMEHVYPLIACRPDQHPDVISAFLTLLHSVMLHRWQYFYTSQVRLGYSPGASDTQQGASENESLHNQQQLLSILQAFGQALLQPDINVFRLSLASLEHLNVKWKLYHKMLFKEHLLSQFLTVLLQTLLHKTHALLNDDIFSAVYNLCAVDFDAFFNTFLLHYLQSVEGLDQKQRELLRRNFTSDTDMPTFVHNVHQLINDMRCYRLCNASLPSGSIVL